MWPSGSKLKSKGNTKNKIKLQFNIHESPSGITNKRIGRTFCWCYAFNNKV